MAPATIQLPDDQKFALMKFRRSVHDILQAHHDDQFLLRWLRARNWDPDAAEKMLRNSMEWRKQWGTDTVLETWQPPQLLLHYTPSGQAGFDKDGSPIIIVPFAGFDVWGLLHSVTKQDIIRYIMKLLECYLEQAQQNDTHQVVVIFDMDRFNVRPYTWKPATELVVSAIQMYEANYPEILKMCYIINVPSIFSLVFNIVKKFMGEYTIKKIQIYKADPKKWQKVLRENLPIENLPQYYGGEAVDPDGDIKCSSKIKPGGKVPKEFYSKNQEEQKNEYVTDTVKNGKQLYLDFLVIEEGYVLRWEFRTEEHDIKFGVTCRTEEGSEFIILPVHKVNSNIVEEAGAVNCDHFPATYTVTFDNSYSVLRSKKISYDIRVESPLDKLNITTLPEHVANETVDTAL